MTRETGATQSTSPWNYSSVSLTNDYYTYFLICYSEQCSLTNLSLKKKTSEKFGYSELTGMSLSPQSV
jgi:hypothetical protein